MYKLSILIAVYNDEQYLEECMDSLLSSTRQSVMYKAIHNNEVEILITNDHDNKDKEFIDIINKIKNKYTLPEDSIKYYINKENQGLLLNQCDMILKANGEYITFIDPDDHYNDNVYGEVFSVLNYTDINKKPELVICNGVTYCIGSGKNVLIYSDKFINKTQFNKNSQIISEHPVIWNRFISTNILKESVQDILSTKIPCYNFVIGNDTLLNHTVASKISSIENVYILSKVVLVEHLKSKEYNAAMLVNDNKCFERSIDNICSLIKITNVLYHKNKLTDFFYKNLIGNILWNLYFITIFTKNNIEVVNIFQKHKISEIIKFSPILFSICIAFYNQSKYVKTCIDSIINQELNYNFIQLVIVNDCSTDNTDEEINKYINEHKDLNIKYIKHKENMGVFEARRTCTNNADGEYTIFVDGDDEFVKNAFANWVKTFFINNIDYDLYLQGRYTSYRYPTTNAFKRYNDRYAWYHKITKYNGRYFKPSQHYENFLNDINTNKFLWILVCFCTGYPIRTSILKSIYSRVPNIIPHFNRHEDSSLMCLIIENAKSINICIDEHFDFYNYFDPFNNFNSLGSDARYNIVYKFNGFHLKTQRLISCLENALQAYELVCKYSSNLNTKRRYKKLFFNLVFNYTKVGIRKTINKQELRVFLKTIIGICAKCETIYNELITIIKQNKLYE